MSLLLTDYCGKYPLGLLNLNDSPNFLKEENNNKQLSQKYNT